MTDKISARGWGGFFLVARVMLYLALPLDALHGYGDFVTFFSVAQISGWPFLDYWVEFPPVFPFLSELLFRLSGGQQHIFTYLLLLVLTLADAGNLYFFERLASQFWKGTELICRLVMYLVLLIALPYGWWYFDPLAVFFLLAGLTFLIEGKDWGGAGLLGAGALVKFIPLIGLAALWKGWRDRHLLRVAIVSISVLTLGFLLPGVFSPDFTLASLRSQSSKGSWETVWALLDGNLTTGNFGPLVERLDPELAGRAVGNPAVVSPWVTLPLFLLAGVGLLARFQKTGSNPVAAVGLAGCLFFLWSPGWSVQWVLYLIPLFLLTLDWRNARLLTVTMVLVNLLEWPVLLSRGWFQLLPATVLVRTLLLLLASILFLAAMQPPLRNTEENPGLARL
ncbi:MAG: 34 kDa antigenic family protein [Chloroflexi bacterium]|nr:34 kDa antigenic family protein [Chloroflexota bacterium]